VLLGAKISFGGGEKCVESNRFSPAGIVNHISHEPEKKFPRSSASAPGHGDHTFRTRSFKRLLPALLTTRTIRFRTCFVNIEPSAAEFFAVKALYRRLSLLLLGHFNKSKTLRPTAVSIGNNIDRSNFTVFSKQLPYFIFRGIKRQITDVDIHGNLSSILCHIFIIINFSIMAYDQELMGYFSSRFFQVELYVAYLLFIKKESSVPSVL
jgi:hypothetical protein